MHATDGRGEHVRAEMKERDTREEQTRMREYFPLRLVSIDPFKLTLRSGLVTTNQVAVLIVYSIRVPPPPSSY